MNKMNRRHLARPFRLPISLALGLLGLLLLPAAGRAAGPEVAVMLNHEPAKFKRGDYGDRVSVSIVNEGDEPTTGPVELHVVLPPSLKPLSISPDTFTCPAAIAVRNGEPFICSLPSNLEAGQSVTVEMKVFVETAAPPSVELEAEVFEGGDPATEGRTTVEVIDRAPFGVASLTAHATDESGTDDKRAGGHPFEASTEFFIPTFTGAWSPDTQPVEDVRNVFTELPPGFIGATGSVPRCTLAQLNAGVFGSCPPDTQVGTAILYKEGEGPFPLAVYNLVPERGYPAEFGFHLGIAAVALYATVRPRDEGYGIDIVSPGASRLFIRGVRVALWGYPSLRTGVGGPAIPFLSNPVDCSDADPTTRLVIDSWQNPARKLGDGFPDLTDPNWKTAVVHNPQVEGCSDPKLVEQWNPTVSIDPIQGANGPIQANQPSGLKVHLHFIQSNDPTDPAYISGVRQYDPETPQAPELKTATVALPTGMAISPSGANGLGACSDQASLSQGDQVNYDTVVAVTCPDSSKIGKVTATSPLLAARNDEGEVTGPEPVTGDVYLLAPHPGDLPVAGQGDGRYRLLIQIEDEKLGLNVKIPGVAVADKATGQLTATFTENPQLPVKDLELEFFKGARAALSTPRTCGPFTTTTDLEAWSAPGTPDAHPQSTFAVGAGPNGTPCVSSLSQRPLSPQFEAGTTVQKAGSSAPFVMNLTRGDAEQEISSLDVTLPAGLTAKLAGVPYCSDAEIAAAKGKSGAAEQANPSCPGATRIGTLTTSVGPGLNPYTVSGNAYLAGPYKRAPLSFVFITPAVAGPFDLGNVVVRAAAYVDPETAQVSVQTDPLPQILDGVPLGIRSIQAKIDRPSFTLNPTSCEPKAISASVGGSSGATANPANHFQVGDCAALGFKPKLKISLTGPSARLGHPALKAVVSYPKEGAYANIARAQVNLPHSEFLDQGNLNKTCTKPVLLAGQCPAKTIYGTARAWTPLLEKPLEGPVYLVGGYGYKLPALVAELNGQIRVVLKGKVDSGPNKGIRNTFEAVPDAPVERFELRMKGGKKYGLLENSEDLCAKPQRAIARFTAQNGMVNQTKPVVGNDCGKATKVKRHRKHSKSKHGSRSKKN